MKSKTPKPPKVADPIPVPQPDDPALIDTKRTARAAAGAREGTSASLLTPGGARGVTGGGGTSRKRLGYGSVSSGY
jgi:hypothetical protein